MSRSLIRKNQLHPDINDLVGQYGSGFFIPNQGVGPVYLTGDQTIGGYKYFSGVGNRVQFGGYRFQDGVYIGDVTLSAQRPFLGASSSQNVNHIMGFSTMPGEFQALQVFANPVSTILNNNNVVFTTGNQTISGVKTFVTGIVAPNIIYNTGNQTISGVKTFVDSGIFNSGIDLRGARLINFTQDIVNVNSNFLISGNFNSDSILANSSSQITGTIVSGNPIGFNASIIQIGLGNVRITGSGSNVIINSFNNRFRTSGQFAQINVLHTGNNGYVMYGNTSL